MERIGKYISAIYRHAQMIINQKLKDTDIKSGQYVFFYFIYHHEGINQKDLSDKLKIGKATTAKAVKNLLESGYIKKEEDDLDKRYCRLYLTDKGKEIAPFLTNTFNEMHDIYSKGFDEEEKIYILNILKRIFDNVYTETKENEYNNK